MDSETKQPADWGKVETLLAQTDTFQVNLHLAPRIGELDGISFEAADGCDVEVVADRMIRDLAHSGNWQRAGAGYSAATRLGKIGNQ